MKKLAAWPLAALTSAVSLAAMCVFDLILSVIYYFLGKVPFLTDLLEYLGDILDLGLTALFAAFLATWIWVKGHTLIEKLYGHEIDYDKGPVYRVNYVFFFLSLAAFLFIGYLFFTQVGATVTAYTADFQGLSKLLLFGKAIKDTFSFVCAQHLVIYKVGSASLILFVVHIFSDHFIE